MHIIELEIRKFLQDLNGYIVPLDLLNKFGIETSSALKKQFERLDRHFTLRMSNIGKPLCQLQMEKQFGSSGMDPIKALLGDLVEDVVLFLLHASNIKVVSELVPVQLLIANTIIKGTLDVILNIEGADEVYDIKSCSEYAFKRHQQESFEEFIANDTFGYVDQLFGYSSAINVKAGGWIFVNKSTGQICVLAVPTEHDKYKQQALTNISNRITNINTPFTRSFSDIPEKFNKILTSNRILGTTCGFCEYKFRCWPGVRLLPQIPSTSKSAKLTYYTHIVDNKEQAA